MIKAAQLADNSLLRPLVATYGAIAVFDASNEVFRVPATFVTTTAEMLEISRHLKSKETER